MVWKYYISLLGKPTHVTEFSLRILGNSVTKEFQYVTSFYVL